MLLSALAVIYGGVLASILLSASWGWTTNALSDLGRATVATAPIFNGSLAVGGILLVAHGVRRGGPTGVATAVSGGFLVLVATFDETYGFLHFAVSAAFFLSLAAYLIVSGTRFRDPVPLALLAAGVASWVLYPHAGITGVAIPEALSFTLAAAWMVLEELRSPSR